MRRFLLALAALAIVAGASLAPANAMTAGTASGIRAAIEDSSVVQDVRYVCRHRGYSSRRVCFFQPGYGYRRPIYRPYRGYGFRGGYGYRGGYHRGGRRW